MFAEFERDVHAMAEKGQPLTCKVLCDTYYGLNVKYFGAAANVDRDIELEWSRIPHFYTPFYVYKYATGFSAAVVLAGNILSGNSEKREKYIDFLKSGGSDYPLEILKKAGVDLTSSEPVERAMKLFSEKIDQLGKYM
jgi:oligoendopeptidase F